MTVGSGNVPPAVVGVIDLGEEHGAVAEGRWAPARGLRELGYRWGPRLDRVRRWAGGFDRRAAWLAVALVLVLATGGAGPAPAAPLRLVMRVPVGAGSSVMIDDGRLVVLGYGQAVAAYSLRDGSPLWRTPLDLQTGNGTMTVSDGVVLVSPDPQNSNAIGTDAIDERTGRELWHSPYEVFRPLSGTGTVLMAPGVPAAVQLVGIRTGEALWSRPADGCLSVVGGTEHVAMLCTDGTLSLIDLPGGAARSFHPVGWSPFANPELRPLGPVLVVEMFGDPDHPVINAYRWSDGSLAWTRPGIGLGDALLPCGTELCVLGATSNVMLDPSSGTPVGPVPPGGPGLFDPIPSGGTELGGRDPAPLVLVPAGRNAPSPDRQVVLRAVPAGVSETLQVFPSVQPLFTGTPVVSLPSFTEAYGKVLVEIVEPDGSIRPLQWLPGLTPSICVALTTYLICPTAAGRATVWQFPTG